MTKTPNRFLEKLKKGPLICAEGYLFEMERRGYLQAGAFVPLVVLEHPEVVEQLHREFVRAGSDVVEAFTYYAHRDKLRIIGRENDLELINRTALQIAKKVADETETLLAGNICNTNIYLDEDKATHEAVRKIFSEQIQWAQEEGADFIIAETISFLGEAQIALEEIKKLKLPSVINLAINRSGKTIDGYTPEEACKILEDQGADVVGLNCIRGPKTMLPLLTKIRKEIKGNLAALPVPYRTTESEPTFQALTDKTCACAACQKDDYRPFPVNLDPFVCTRTEMADFTHRAREIGVNFFGICCGAGPHHIRAMAEALGRKPVSSAYSADMSKHVFLGKDKNLKQEYFAYKKDL